QPLRPSLDVSAIRWRVTFESPTKLISTFEQLKQLRDRLRHLHVLLEFLEVATGLPAVPCPERLQDHVARLAYGNHERFTRWLQFHFDPLIQEYVVAPEQSDPMQLVRVLDLNPRPVGIDYRHPSIPSILE